MLPLETEIAPLEPRKKAHDLLLMPFAPFSWRARSVLGWFFAHWKENSQVGSF